jgi:hypothetical protein
MYTCPACCVLNYDDATQTLAAAGYDHKMEIAKEIRVAGYTTCVLLSKPSVSRFSSANREAGTKMLNMNLFAQLGRDIEMEKLIATPEQTWADVCSELERTWPFAKAIANASECYCYTYCSSSSCGSSRFQSLRSNGGPSYHVHGPSP